MECSVYQSKRFSLTLLIFVVAFATLAGWFMPRVPRSGGLTFMHWGFAILISVALVVLIRALVVKTLALRVNGTGIYYPRGWIPLIEWVDVIAVERLPKVRRIATKHHGTKYYTSLRDVWRPLAITVRHREKYLLRVPQIFSGTVPSMGTQPDQTTIFIGFVGLTPGSDLVEACIRRHLTQ